MSILRVEGLNKHFRGLKAVDDVGFEVEEGSILGVIGPNGAGKTTMFNLIAGAIRPDSGRVFLEGQDITGKPPHVIAQAGMARTFQLMRPFYSMSVLDNVTIAVMAGKGGHAEPPRPRRGGDRDRGSRARGGTPRQRGCPPRRSSGSSWPAPSPCGRGSCSSTRSSRAWSLPSVHP